MKRLGLLCLIVLLGSIVSVSGDVPRHMDPEVYELAEPDPEVLYMVYHNVYEGIILENMTVSREWLDYAIEMYSVDELNVMLEDYRGELEVQADNLNLTRHHMDLAIQFIGEYNLSGAKSSFFKGLSHLEDSNETITVLRNSTRELGAMLGTHPDLLLDDVNRLEDLVGDYRDFAQILANYVGGEEISGVDIEVIKEEFKDVLDPDLLDEVEKYLDDLGGGVNLSNLTRTDLSMDMNASSVWVGDYLLVSGRLIGGDGGLEGRRIAFKMGNYSWVTVTGFEGYYSKLISVPYLYKSSVDLRGFYWPDKIDAETFTPATVVRRFELLYYTPVLTLDYDDIALPGRLWNVTGKLSFNDTGLNGNNIVVSGFGVSKQVVTRDDGYFELGLGVPFDHDLEWNIVLVESLGDGVYSGAEEFVNVSVIKKRLNINLDTSRWVFSGSGMPVHYTVSSDGVKLDGCRIRLISEEDVGLGYSQAGKGSVRVHIPLWRLGGDYNWRLEAKPKESWIRSGSVSGSFYIVNTVVVMLSLGLLGAGGVYLKRNLGSRPDDMETPEETILTPVSETVCEPAISKGSFSGLFLAALRFIEDITGLSMKPSDTLREYLSRVLDTLGERLGGLFSQLVSRYERWLYGRPKEPELEKVELLVSELEEDED
ncbi:DUF4129 domain-containing protein [Candidatus Bathyarchaeota archaeon]|nr:DUF4129 domain-containing protein [Candidatus Bathyarchaeota archaeon]